MQMCQIDSLQNDVLSQMGLGDSVQKCEIELPELVYCLLATPPNIGELALGKAGRKLIEFISKIDLEHPDVLCVLGEILHNDLNFRQQILEAIELAEKNKHLLISANFHKLVDRNKLKSIQNDFATRLLKFSKDRNAIRKQRCVELVNLETFYKKGSEIWNRQPTDFKAFNRYNIPYLEDIEYFENEVDRYEELGCETIASKITNEIRKLRANISERYYGFNRITVTTAAIILAKMHGYKLKTQWDIHDNKKTTITGYEPKIYPIHEMTHTASNSMLELISHLDSFPETGGKPLFDDFILLVPDVESCPILLGERDRKSYWLCYWR